MKLYAAESIYQLERAAVRDDRLSEIELMRRAGENLWQHITLRWPEVSRVTILAGAGNNGGDAFVVAACAELQGCEVQLLVLGNLKRQSPAASHHAAEYQRLGGSWQQWHQQSLNGQVIVDGLLGIGFKGDLRSETQNLVNQANLLTVPKVSIDIPSGLCAATGHVSTVAIKADLTISFIVAKCGQFLGDGPDYCGKLLVDSLGVSTRVLNSVAADLNQLDFAALPVERKNNSHKNQFGHLLVVGGGRSMCGAASLAAQAALRCGVGLVTQLVHPECVPHSVMQPEIMVSDWRALESLLPEADVVLVGPGLGDSPEADQILHQLKACEHPMVVDASALKASFLSNLKSPQRVITPHPGEAAMILGSTSKQVQADRVKACLSLQQAVGGVTVLKGSGTLIASAGQMALNSRGNAGMATAGMGDVLAGMIAALMGQGMTAFESAKTGVFLHALAAEDFCREQQESGLIASDIVSRIPLIMKRLADDSPSNRQSCERDGGGHVTDN